MIGINTNILPQSHQEKYQRLFPKPKTLVKIKSEQTITSKEGNEQSPKDFMINFSASCLEDMYNSVNAHSYDRVKSRNIFMLSVFSMFKVMGNRLFDMIFLIRYILERRLLNNEFSFRVFDEIINKSMIYQKTDQTQFVISQDTRLLEETKTMKSLLGGIVKVTFESPGKLFIQIKKEKGSIPKDFLATFLNETYGIPSDYILIKEVSANDMIIAHLSTDELKSIIKKEFDPFFTEEKSSDERAIFLNSVVDKVFSKIYNYSSNNFLLKFSKANKDMELMLREINANISLKQQRSEFSPKNNREANLSKENREIWEERDICKYPMTKAYNFKKHSKIVNPINKPYEAIVDKIFTDDRKKPEIGVEPEVKYLDYDVISEQKKVVEKMSVEVVKGIIQKEKYKRIGIVSEEDERGLYKLGRHNKDGVIIEDYYNHQLKEIMDFGSTLRSLKYCLEKKVRETLTLATDIPSVKSNVAIKKHENRAKFEKFANVLYP